MKNNSLVSKEGFVGFYFCLHYLIDFKHEKMKDWDEDETLQSMRFLESRYCDWIEEKKEQKKDKLCDA